MLERLLKDLARQSAPPAWKNVLLATATLLEGARRMAATGCLLVAGPFTATLPLAVMQSNDYAARLIASSSTIMFPKHARRWPKHARGEYIANWIVGGVLVVLAVALTVELALVALR